MTDHKLLLACDLDRTVLPCGDEELSSGAMARFHAVANNANVTLAYLTGRNLALIHAALDVYKIPIPDVAVGDVGTSMYFQKDGFTLHEGWSNTIVSDWGGHTGAGIALILTHIDGLHMQEEEHQNTFKLSYYTALDVDGETIKQNVADLLVSEGVNASVIFSIDKAKGVGLLDIVPKRATKKDALDYLVQYLCFGENAVVYAGDSGNDVEPLTSGYNAIVVNNAREQVKDTVRTLGTTLGIEDKIYFASGGFDGMNGNYVAGILEGLEHFGFSTFLS